jgi:hypothetical protein
MGLRTEQRILTLGIPNGRETPEKMFNILNHQGNANMAFLTTALCLPISLISCEVMSWSSGKDGRQSAYV